VVDDHIDLLSITAHKIYGPKGIGALYVRRRQPAVALAPQMDGGGHELGLRSGTLNVPAIAGFGEACVIAGEEMPAETARLRGLRDRLLGRLEAALEGSAMEIRVNGSWEHRLAGNLNLAFAGVDAQALLMSLPEIALSTGSACSSASAEPSHVLRAIGLSEDAARGSVRFGLGRFNTRDDIDYAADRLAESARQLRRLSPAAMD